MGIECIREFRAVGDTVIGVPSGGNEEQVVICQCCSAPGWIAEEVARQIARLLNTPELEKFHDIGFSIPGTMEDDRWIDIKL